MSKPKKRSRYELEFETRLRQLAQDLPDPQIEFEFYAERGWRFDFAWESYRVAVEIDGGNRMARINRHGVPFAIGRHTQAADYDKRNAATLAGWRVLYFLPEQIRKDPDRCIAQLRELVDPLPFADFLPLDRERIAANNEVM